MGLEHFRRLGAEAETLRVCDRNDADQAEYAERIAEAGVVWFSGGSPAYLASALEGTACFRALEEANRNGAAVAGSSGGLGVMNAHLAFADAQPGSPSNGLGLAAPLRAMAHFDRMEVRRPEFLRRVLDNIAPGQTAVGVDEDTAVVWRDGAWQVMGHKRVVVYGEGERAIFRPGERVDLLPLPRRLLSNAAS
jgi:cyanophycinase